MTANLELVREPSAHGCTIGKLYLNGQYFCYTLEDVVRPAGEYVAGKTAIAAGTYAVALTVSKRFRKLMPLLSGGTVTGRGVRLHAGNTAADTLGCILVGLALLPSQTKIYRSQEAFEALMRELLSYRTITLTIR